MAYDYKKKWAKSLFMSDVEENLNKHVITAIPGGSVLDVGCGTGRFTGCFNPTDYLGVDISPRAIAKAQEDYPDHAFSVVDLIEDEIKGGWDYIFTWTVLEHIPPEFIEGVATKLRRAGKRLVIAEPTNEGQGWAAHCFPHDYGSLFDIYRVIPIAENFHLLVANGHA